MVQGFLGEDAQGFLKPSGCEFRKGYGGGHVGVFVLCCGCVFCKGSTIWGDNKSSNPT